MVCQKAPALSRRAMLSWATRLLGTAGVGLLVGCGSSTAGTASTASPATVTQTLVRTVTATVTRAAVSTVTAATTVTVTATAPTPAGAPTYLEFWTATGKEREPMFLQTVQSFEQATPGIRVAYTDIPSSPDFLQKLTASIAGNTTPDVVSISGDWMAQYGGQGALLDLTDLAQRDKFAMAEVYEPIGVDQIRRYSIGKFYGLTNGVNIIHVYYNRDAFQEAGLADPNDLYAKGQWTWAAILDAGQKLTKRTGPTVDRYGYDADIDIFRATAFTYENAGMLFDEGHGRFVFAEQQAALDAVQWLVDLNLKYHLPATNDVEKQFGYTVGLFAKGKSAMFHGWASYLAGMVKEIGQTFRFGVAPMPTGKQEATFDSGGFTSIMRASAKPEASWTFLKYADGVEAYRILLQNDFIVLPALKDAQSKAAFAKLPVFGADNLVKHAQHAVTTNYVTPKVADMWGAFGKVAGDIWSGKVAVRTGLTTAQQQMQTLYDGSK